VLENCRSSEELGNVERTFWFSNTSMSCWYVFGKKKIRIGEGSETSRSLDFIDERVPSAGTDMNSDKGDFDLFDKASHR